MIVKTSAWRESILGPIEIGDSRSDYILHEIIEKTWVKLQAHDVHILLEAMILVINLLHKKVNNDLWDQLTQNSNLDLYAIMNLILPFIKDDSKRSELVKLEDLYLTQDSNDNFVYTNSQYNRCIRDKISNKTSVTFRPFLQQYFEQNLDLLLSSIEACANKLYVNWYDIIPITMDNYENTDLFKDTQTKIIQSAQEITLVNGFHDASPGLSWQDIYNSISNYLFHGIGPYRWIMFDLKIGEKMVTYLEYLESHISFKTIWDQKSWDQLLSSDINRFEAEWDQFLKDPNPINDTVLGKFFFYFVKYHPESERMIREGLISLSVDYEDLDDDVDIVPELTRNARTGLANVPIDMIYLFFYDQFMQFQKSWFYYTIKIKKQTIFASQKLDDLDITLFVTPKTFYNFAESLTHYVDRDRYPSLPIFWQSLEEIFRDMFFVRLFDIPYSKGYLKNDWNGINWFVRNKYFRMIYPNTPNSEFNRMNKMLYEMIKPLLANVITEAMIYHGVLSQFVPTPKITNERAIIKEIGTNDTNKISSHQQKVASKLWLSNESYSNHAFYWLTGKRYGDGPKIGDKTWFESLVTDKDQNWMNTYAMNWVSQISFYHRFIHNRVVYVTGSTGVGKSTQIPKLAMYAKLMLHYIHAKVICTQPRIDPTVGNAKTVSYQMGVPIIDGDTSTANYQIQYDYEGGSHVISNNSYLRFVTDGKLYVQMQSSPFLTAVSRRNQPEEFMYSSLSKNLYDVVIVDEAHEHNVNMDMILTLARDAAYVNNNLKLLIVSATMDDDEPIYRRYYRKINDNRSYPLSVSIDVNRLDRVNVDRRVHISPPGATTRYVITSHYLSKEESDKITPKNYLQDGIEFTIKLVNKTSSGDLLLFVATIANVNEAVKKINEETSSEVLALAFHGELTEQQKKVVRDIDKEKGSITKRKEDILLPDSEIKQRVNAGTYKRAVIVATNIAEASITVSSLRYVIDTGYANTVVYDPIQDITKAIVVPISKTSSEQRKGRVGRVAPGEVYFRYDKEKIDNNKTSYKIADSDVKYLVLDLTQSEKRDSSIIIPDNDINNYHILREIESEGRGFDIINHVNNPIPYLDIIRKQYLLSPQLNDPDQYYTYIGKYDPDYSNHESYEYLINNHDDYDYQYNHQRFISSCYTGYPSAILFDNSLSFYLIHPDENVILRNRFTGELEGLQNNALVSPVYYHYLFGDNKIFVTDSDPSKTFDKIDFTTFHLGKIQLAYQNLQSDALAIQLQNSSIDHVMTYPKVPPEWNRIIKAFFERFNGDRLIYIKSPLYQSLSDIQRMVSYKHIPDIKAAAWYAYSLSYGLQDDVLAMILLIYAVPSLKGWIGDLRAKGDVKKVLMHLNQQSDIYFIWQLWMSIKDVMPDMSVDFALLEREFEASRDRYRSGGKLDPSQKSIFDRLQNSSRLNYQEYLRLYRKNIDTDPDVNKKIESIAKMNGISNSSALLKFYKRYEAIRFDIAIKTRLVEPETVEWVKEKLFMPSIFPNPTDWEIVLQQYIRAYSSNLIYSDYDRYIQLNTGLVIALTEWNKDIEQTFIKEKPQFLIYQSISSAESQSVSYLTHVKLEWFAKLNPILNPKIRRDQETEMIDPSNTLNQDRYNQVLQYYSDQFNYPEYVMYASRLGIDVEKLK